MNIYNQKLKEAAGRALHLCILKKYSTYANCAKEWGVTRQLPALICKQGQFTYKQAYRLALLFDVPAPLFSYEPLVVLTHGSIASYETFVEQAFKAPADRAYVKAGAHIKYRDINPILTKYSKEDVYGRNKKRSSNRRKRNKREQSVRLPDVDSGYDE